VLLANRSKKEPYKSFVKTSRTGLGRERATRIRRRRVRRERGNTKEEPFCGLLSAAGRATAKTLFLPTSEGVRAQIKCKSGRKERRGGSTGKSCIKKDHATDFRCKDVRTAFSARPKTWGIRRRRLKPKRHSTTAR